MSSGEKRGREKSLKTWHDQQEVQKARSTKLHMNFNEDKQKPWMLFIPSIHRLILLFNALQSLYYKHCFSKVEVAYSFPYQHSHPSGSYYRFSVYLELL